MEKTKPVGAILLMGGEGARFGSSVPKQFHLLGGKKVYQHALETLIASHLFEEILLICHPDWIHLPINELANTKHRQAPSCRCIKGGKTRQESSYLGLKAFKTQPDIVLIHDAVRPFVSEQILRENVEGAIHWGATDTCIPSADTLVYAPNKNRIESIPKREEYLRGQTPQTFKMEWILEAHEKALSDGIQNASDDCRLVLRLGKPVHIVAGEESNLKITSEFDLMIANAHLLAKECSTRDFNQSI